MPAPEPSRRHSTPRTFLVALFCAAALAPLALIASAAQAQELPAEQTSTTTTSATGDEAPSPATETGGETETTDETDTTAPSDEGEPIDETGTEDESADEGEPQTARAEKRRLRLTVERVSSERAFFAGKRKVEFTFKTAGGKRDLRIQAVRKKGRKVAMGWKLNNVESGVRKRVRWNGATRSGKPVKGGQYYFRVREQDGPEAERAKAKGGRTVKVYQHIFPVRGRHSYGDGFGAGRGHQGADVFANCGTKMVAARAGKVQYRGYQSSAGNYVVIDGKATKRDYVYMHLTRPAKVRQGKRVKAGQTIGKVGETGNASGCHLHMEVWRGGWYEGGGKPERRIKKLLKGWDRYS
ncbi:M23 family metallopeptidase [Thermoleophilia bacterium SCSIO 60948]|nr:M23 family metallopeptidase [Thermoleophilia bacterium SCSIO 60948]